MDRLPSLSSLRSLANYGEDEIDSDDEQEVARKKAKTEEEIGDENSRSKEDGSDLDIVVSDEENDSSRSGSTESKVVVTQPRVNIASRLVSYGGDEDEEEDAAKNKENDIDDATKTELQETFPSEPSLEENQDKPEVKSTSEEAKSNSSAPEKKQSTNEDTIPKELRDHLAIVKAIKATLPEEPDGRCSNSLQEKIEKLLDTKLRTGRDLKHTIQRKKNFRNPSIYEKLVSFCSINETGTNYPRHIYDPFSWTEESFYENLSKLQKENYDLKKQKERSKVEFISATKKSVTSTDDAAKKRKSKWDVTSSGIAASTSSIAAKSVISVQAVVAAKAKVINTVATMQAKKA